MVKTNKGGGVENIEKLPPGLLSELTKIRAYGGILPLSYNSPTTYLEFATS